MKLLTLLKDLPSHTLTGSPQVKISHLECDSRRILPGSCYIALKGTRADGHEFIPEAIRRGACAVVAEMPCTQEAREAGVSWVEVNDSRLAVSLMGAAWNGRPSRHMTMIGVTGTNGKTTTAYIAHSLLKQSWLRAGLIGTIAYDNGEEITPSTHTTPGPLELEHLLKEMYENGCRGVSMEVSSHALDQERVAGINFNVGIFTNLTQDHLDYHHTMENYFQAKAKLFEQMAQDTKSRRKPVAVINIDDAYGRRLAEMFSGRMTVKTYGSALGADFRMLVHHATAKGSEYELEYKGKSYLVRVPLIGKFNMYNSLAALAAVICAGIPVRDAIANLQNIPQVPGRLELFTHPGGAQIFIDYAHTPDALEKRLQDAQGTVLPPPDYRVRLRRGPGQGKTPPDGSRSRAPVRRLHRHFRQSQKRGTPLHHQPDCGGHAGRQIRHHPGPGQSHCHGHRAGPSGGHRPHCGQGP